jgi:hypothetical protein
MDDKTIDGLTAKLTDVYLRILNKGYDARGRAERKLTSTIVRSNG